MQPLSADSSGSLGILEGMFDLGISKEFISHFYGMLCVVACRENSQRTVATYLEFEKRPLEELPNNVAGLADLQAHKLENKAAFEKFEKGLEDFRARKQA